MLPLECQYLNKNALTTLAGPLTPPVKHFQLKRKPKSATLRAELLQKCECPPSRRRAVGTLSSRGRPAELRVVLRPRSVLLLSESFDLWLLTCLLETEVCESFLEIHLLLR